MEKVFKLRDVIFEQPLHLFFIIVEEKEKKSWEIDRNWWQWINSLGETSTEVLRSVNNAVDVINHITLLSSELEEVPFRTLLPKHFSFDIVGNSYEHINFPTIQDSVKQIKIGIGKILEQQRTNKKIGKIIKTLLVAFNQKKYLLM